MLLSADYPYYRDTPDRWEGQLRNLRAMGIPILTCYLPWRHHQPHPSQAPDFEGRTQPNRNVRGFLTLCQELGFQVIVKPGPFIHAETNYGGLPDWVCPRFAPIEPIRDHRGIERLWSGAALKPKAASPEEWPLPAPFAPIFLEHVHRWMQAVGEEVLRPLSHPRGPIVAVQIGNEGVYSDGQAAPWAYDYSSSGIAQFFRFLQEKYLHLERLREAYGRDYTTWEQIQPPRLPLPSDCPASLLEDWGEFQAWYLNRVFHVWAEPLQTDLPVYLNQNPPLDAPYGLDAWLTRVEPERWNGLRYGFTNWVGDVSANPSAFDRYALTARRYPGVNLEENWGFATLYDPAYADASTSFYQTLLILNAGAQGFNIYTGVATGEFDPNLTVLPQVPYPDLPPIPLSGEWTDKAEIVRWLMTFFRRHGEEFLQSRPQRRLAWGLSLRSARLDAWKEASQPRHGAYLSQFMQAARRAHQDYALLNLGAVDLDDLLTYERIYTAAPAGLSPAEHQSLRAYLEHGGEVFWLGPLTAPDLPQISHRFRQPESLEIPPASFVLDGEADLWLRVHPQRDVYYLTVLLSPRQTRPVSIRYAWNGQVHHLRLQAAPAGGALLRVENGQVSDYIIKGVNRFLGYAGFPRLELDGVVYTADQPGDLARLEGQTWTVHAVIGSGG